MRKYFTARNWFVALAAAGFVFVLVLSGCSTLDTAISMAMNDKATSGSSSSQQPENQQGSGSNDQATSPQVYSMQFNAFYGGFWNFGWFGYGDPNYKQGQGTVWEISGTDSSKPVSFERALLKGNSDGSMWWRFKMNTEDETIVYEFLVGSDSKVQKVRYKDPKTGQIGEFVPTQESSRPSSAPQLTRDQISNAYVGKETVQVPAGSFTADHYTYLDTQSNWKSDMWIDKSVPGYMVKFTGTNQGNHTVSNGRLMQIESNATTELGSF